MSFVPAPVICLPTHCVLDNPNVLLPETVKGERGEEREIPMNAENVVEAEIEAKETTGIVLETSTGIENDDVTETERVKGVTVALETDQTADTLIGIANVRGIETETEMIAGAKGMITTSMTRGLSEKGMYAALLTL